MICGCIGIVAEVSGEALMKRHKQGWVNEVIDNLDHLVKRVREAKNNNEVSANFQDYLKKLLKATFFCQCCRNAFISVFVDVTV